MIRQLYNELIYEKRRQHDFWILISFIITFGVARLVVHLFPHLFLHVHGVHVHHLTYGIILLAVAGYIALTRQGPVPSWVAIVFGVGLALAVDETGMWLQLTAQYNNDQSEDAIVLVLSGLIYLVYFADFFAAIFARLMRRP